MEIEFFYLPALGVVVPLFLAWVFSGFKSNQGEVFLSSSLNLILLGIAILSTYFSIVYYGWKILVWLYNNITIV